MVCSVAVSYRPKEGEEKVIWVDFTVTQGFHLSSLEQVTPNGRAAALKPITDLSVKIRL